MIQYFSYDYNDHISKLDLIIAELTKLGHRLSNGVWKDPLSNTYIGYIESDKATDILTRFNLTILNSEQVIILVEKYFENNPPPIKKGTTYWEKAKVVNGRILKEAL